MLLHKLPTPITALLNSHRHNAQQSTGPRSARGNPRSRLNRLRNGARSSEYIGFVDALLDAPLDRMGVATQALLPFKQAHHLFGEIAEKSVQADIGVGKNLRLRRTARKLEMSYEQSRKAIENKQTRE